MEFILSDLVEQVTTARAAQRPIQIHGGRSKRFYGEAPADEGASEWPALDMAAYRGIISYEPSELVITARAGTLLSEIEQALETQNQMLAFEPPRLGAASTLGGCVASGLSGPRRMAAGSLRDYVLGTKLLDSTGAVLTFGGQVMKNVAGYDMSRLLAGSLGIFGPILEVSLKVMPKPFEEATMQLEADEATALRWFNQWRPTPLPVSATAWTDHDARGLLRVRLSGSEPAVRKAAQTIGGERIDPVQASAWWTSIRDQTHPFFRAATLWRASVPPTAAALQAGPTLIEWNGGLRWVGHDVEPAGFRAQVASLGGHATLYRAAVKPKGVPVFHPLDSGLLSLNRRLKQELDPFGIFNPKRMFPDF